MRSQSAVAAARSSFAPLIRRLMRIPWNTGTEAETPSDPESCVLST